MAGIINVAFFRSFNPVAGQFRELDAIASVIIGGGSIFGGYGTIIGSLAGAAVITLVRALLQLNIITADGRSIVLPQHWVNAFIGMILIVAVLVDIWVRQANIFGRLREALARRRAMPREARPFLRSASTRRRRSSRCAASARRSARSRRWPTSISSSIRARSWAWSATTRPASRR